MPDINLLKNTLSPEEKRKREKSSSSFDLTKPEIERSEEETTKKTFSPGSFFRRLFGRKTEGDEAEKTIQAPLIKASEYKLEDSMKTQAPEKEKNLPEDIFAPEKRENEPMVSPAPVEELGFSPEAKMPPSRPPKLTSNKEKKKEKEAKKEERDSFLVNLLPEELIGREEPRKKLIIIGLSGLGAALLVVIIYFALAFYQSSIITKTAEVKTQKIAVDSQINQYKKVQQESIDFKEKITAVTGLLNNHIYWTNFFAKLEEYTLPDVYYTGSVNVSKSNVITLAARAPDYAKVAEQLVVLKNATDFVSSVEISAANASESASGSSLPEGTKVATQVNFSVTLTLTPALLYKTEGQTNTNSNLNSNINLNANVNLNENNNTNSLLSP